MCYVGYYKQEKECRVAKKAIKCFKVCIIRNNKIYSYDREYEYKLNKIYKSGLEISNWNNSIIIGKGLHSYGNFKNIEEIIDAYIEDLEINYNASFSKNNQNIKIKLIECIIPKNSLYYRNKLAELVSNQIILTKVTEL